jgi:AraC-like DNA-binding protein
VKYADAIWTPGNICAIVSARAFLLQAQILRDARASPRGAEPRVFDLLAELHGASALATRNQSRVVTEIRRLLNESPSRHLALEAIAREFYMSPFTVSRLFHRETGMRLRDYSSRLRLRKALHLLMNSRKTLTSIAIDLGFYDESHFSKAFRAEFGVSPHSVRKY